VGSEGGSVVLTWNLKFALSLEELGVCYNEFLGLLGGEIVSRRFAQHPKQSWEDCVGARQKLSRSSQSRPSSRDGEGATHIDISHGDARHDCRYVNWYLRSGGIILRSSGRKVW
jgi:hypothetical protein